jgi:hypothetical protein
MLPDALPLHDVHDARILRQVQGRPINPRHQLQPENERVSPVMCLGTLQNHPNLKAQLVDYGLVQCVLPAVRSVPAPVQGTLKVVGVLEHPYILCANIAYTLRWLLPALLRLPSWIVITGRRSSVVLLLGWESLLRIAGIRLVALKSTRVGWGLVEGLSGVLLLLVVWRCATTTDKVAILRVGRWSVATGLGRRRWETLC